MEEYLNGCIGAREFVVKKNSQNIHELMSSNFYYHDSNLDLLRETSALIDELMSDKTIKNRFHQLLSGMDDFEIKIKMFSVIRNLLVHFPFYKTWDDIYIDNNIVVWNDPKHPERLSIKSFFENNENKELSYDIYFRISKFDLEKYTIKFNVPSLEKGFFIKDFMSIKDLYYTFFLIDHLLEDFGIDTQVNYPPSC